MGYESPKVIRSAILSEIRIDLLTYQNENEYGRIYRAYIDLKGASINLKDIRRMEWQANHFAACLLLRREFMIDFLSLIDRFEI